MNNSLSYSPVYPPSSCCSRNIPASASLESVVNDSADSKTHDSTAYDSTAYNSVSWTEANPSPVLSTEAKSIPPALSLGKYQVFLDFDAICYDYLTSTVHIWSQKASQNIPASSLFAFFDQIALQFGNRVLAGRSAFHKGMKQNKFIPLLLSLKPLLVMIPDSSMKDAQATYINFDQIRQIQPAAHAKNRAMITFEDGLKLEVASYKRMERNILQTKWFLAKIYDSQSSQ